MTGALRIEGLSVTYGHVEAVRDVSLCVPPGAIVALLGANGAGKSSLLQAISGMASSSGTIRCGDVDLQRLRAEERARHVAHVPEGRRLFADLTVRENLLLGAYRSARSVRARRLAEVVGVLPALEGLLARRAGDLSGGQQQMVAIGRGLMTGAGVLMIDELSLGLAPIVVGEFATTLPTLRDRGISVLLVEQYVQLALRIADEAAVIERGRILLSGPAARVREEVAGMGDAYLGTPAVDGAAPQV